MNEPHLAFGCELVSVVILSGGDWWPIQQKNVRNAAETRGCDNATQEEPMLLGLVLFAGMVALIMFVSSGRQRSRPHYGGDTGSGDSSWMFSGSGSDGSSDCGSSDGGGCDGGGGGDGGGD